MGFYQNFGRDAKGQDGIPSIDPVLAGFEEAGYLIEVLHISSGKMAVFPSWITDFSDSYASSWNSETIYGRSDPIGIYQGTTRTISVALSIPSYSVVEARENMHQLEHLMANLYPSYKKDTKGTLTMVGSPMEKVKFANLIKNAEKRNNAISAAEGGLSGWINNVTFTPNLESGFHHMSPNMAVSDQNDYNGAHSVTKFRNKSHTLLPKVIDFSFTLTVVHEHPLGWQGKSWLNETGLFPYGTETISGGQHAGGNQVGATTRTGGKVAKALVANAFKGRPKV